MFLKRSHVYTVHINPAQPKPYENALFIDEGFSFAAFIFSFLWALYHRLWWPFIFIACAHLIIADLVHSGSISQAGRGILDLSVNIIIGFQANDWLRTKLAKKGFVTADIVAGDCLIRAEQRFYDRYFAEHASPAA